MLEQCIWCQRKPRRETQASGDSQRERGGHLVLVPLKHSSEPRQRPSAPLLISVLAHFPTRHSQPVSMIICSTKFLFLCKCMRIFNV